MIKPGSAVHPTLSALRSSPGWGWGPSNSPALSPLTTSLASRFLQFMGLLAWPGAEPTGANPKAPLHTLSWSTRCPPPAGSTGGEDIPVPLQMHPSAPIPGSKTASAATVPP